MSVIETTPRWPGWLRSALAVLAGLIAIVGLSMVADEIAYSAGLFPRPPAVTYEALPYVIATAYRGAIGLAGAWIATRLAPRRPMRHALAIGLIGVALSTVGLIATLSYDLGPAWYPTALLIITLPCALLGGRLALKAQP